MKRIVFFVNQLCGRGTTDMIYNYAKYNEVLLGNKSIIMTLTTPKNFKHNQESIKTIQDELEVVYVDGYDKEKNIVIEYDEKHHFKNKKLREKDIKRQNEIEDYLKCKFIRISEFDYE